MLKRQAFLPVPLVVLVLMLVPCISAAQDIQPFTTDGCSAFPDGSWRNNTLWQDCCIAHDLAYWAGGTREDREAVDEVFAECVAEVANIHLANSMTLGVRLGGAPIFPTTYRWGYGWPFWRGYAPLTEREKTQIIESIDKLPADALNVQSSWPLIDFNAWQKRQESSTDSP